MINIGLVCVIAILVMLGNFGFAFWVTLFAIINGVGSAVIALINPGWYTARRMQAGLDVDIFDPYKGIKSLVITKIIINIPLAVFAYWIGTKAGYF